MKKIKKKKKQKEKKKKQVGLFLQALNKFGIRFCVYILCRKHKPNVNNSYQSSEIKICLRR